MSKNKIKLVLIIIFIIGLSVLLYPTISQYWNSYTQSKVVADYDKIFQTTKNKDYSDIFNKANQYNIDLSNLEYPLLQYKQLSDYNNLLNINGNGMMGYISIDKIKVEIPIYHTTKSSVLNVAVGHLEGSSLPIGGENTHSVLSAHRGLPSAKLFTDLNKLEIGDTFEITILDKKFSYQVDDISIVEPEDITKLEIVDGEDYVTLLTCTPYGLNTHRLLVRGKRIANITDKKVYVTTEAFRINSLIIIPIVASPIILVLLLIILMKPVKKKQPEITKNKNVEVKNEKN